MIPPGQLGCLNNSRKPGGITLNGENMKAISLTKRQDKLIGSILIAFVFIIFVVAAYTLLPVHENANPPDSWGWGIDWKGNIRFAAIDLISGHTPYTNYERCYPPWIYLLVSPLTALSPDLATAMLFVLTYMVYSFVILHLKATPWSACAFMLNRFSLNNAINANLDFLTVLGFALPPQIGLFFVLSKPQIGFAIALYWLVEAWRKGRIREVIRVFAPVTAAYLISFLIYGLWPLKVMGMTNNPFNSSLWPFGIPLGIFLLYKAIRDKNQLFAMGASPFLAPYVNITSYAVVLIPIIPNALVMLIVSALSWVAF